MSRRSKRNKCVIVELGFYATVDIRTVTGITRFNVGPFRIRIDVKSDSTAYCLEFDFETATERDARYAELVRLWRAAVR